MEKFINPAGQMRADASRIEACKFQVLKFLQTVRMDILSSILSELLEKSTVDSRYLQEKDVSFRVEYDERQSANARHESGSIVINSAKYDFNSDYRRQYRRILSAYIHEYVHALATSKRINHDTGFKWVSDDGHVHNVPLNEGFTELIADYVYEEYLQRSGDASYVGQKEKERTVKGYPQERIEAMGLVKKISEQTEVPEDVVFKGFMRAYFSQDNDSLENVKKSLSLEPLQ